MGSHIEHKEILDNVAILDHNHHSRVRVYPQVVGDTITLVATATANTFGSWTQIVPIDIINFEYHVVGVGIEVANLATTYLVQLGYSILPGSDPTAAQILGEARLLLTSPVGKAMELLDILAASCPADAKLWGRIKSASGTADELEVSVAITRHIDISNPISLIATWPWSS